MYTEDRDLTIATPHGVLIHRVGFLIFEGGKVLLQKSYSGYWFIPGGRVGFGESTPETLGRELMEELGVSGFSPALAALVENFFMMKGKSHHEIAVYYRVTPDAPLALPQDGQEIWGWHDLSTLPDLDLRPQVLKATLPELQSGFHHKINRE